jgi:GNAT superfamily N-acetyltransferase
MIRTAGDEDVPAIAALLRDGHSESPRWGVVPLDMERLTSGIAERVPSGGVFVAEQDASIVGVLIGSLHRFWFSDEGYASNMQFYVSRVARGRLIGVRLIQAFEEWAIRQGVIELRLSVDAAINDETAVRIFEAMGYEKSCASYTKMGVPAESISSDVETVCVGGA